MLMNLYRNTSYTHDLILHNDHDLTGPEPCFVQLSFDTLAILTCAADKYNAPGSSFINRYCKDCWILNLRCHIMKEDADVAYHMKAKYIQ
jgi:hypothetical protein